MGGFAEKNGRAGSPLPAASLAETAWPMVRLGDVCEIVLGGTPSTKICEYWGGSIPWLTPGDMGKTPGLHISNTSRTLTKTGLVAGSTLFSARSVIISTRAPIGYVKINDVPMCTNQGCKTLVPNDKVYAEYLAYNLLDRVDELNELGTGTTFKELATGVLRNILIPLPPLAVQREIVERLEKELGEAEKVTAGFRRIAEKAEAEFKAELDETFKALEDDVSRGGAETRRVRLGDVCETGSGGTPLSSNREYYDGGDVPWLRSGEICKRDIGNTEYCITKKGLNSSSAKIFPADSVVVAMYGATAGQVGILRIASSTNQAICAILPSEKFVPEFLYYQLCWLNDEMVSQAQGGAQPNISQIKIKNLNVVWPILSLQQASISRLDAARERCDKIKAEAEKGLKAAENLRKAILKEAFEQ